MANITEALNEIIKAVPRGGGKRIHITLDRENLLSHMQCGKFDYRWGELLDHKSIESVLGIENVEEKN